MYPLSGSSLFMHTRKEDISQLIVKIIFMILFIVIVFSINGKQERSTYADSPCGINTELHSGSSKAVISDPGHLPVFQNSLPISYDEKRIVFYNYKLKIAVYNNTISQQISFIEKTSELLKPQNNYRFYYYLFHIDADDSPALS